MKVWDNKVVTPDFAIQLCANQVPQWKEAQLCKGKNVNAMASNQPHSDVHWRAPMEGELKINVDTSVKAGDWRFGIGMVLRDHQGSFCKARSLCKGGEVSVFKAEVQAILEALRWSVELGLGVVTIENDLMLATQTIKKDGSVGGGIGDTGVSMCATR